MLPQAKNGFHCHIYSRERQSVEVSDKSISIGRRSDSLVLETEFSGVHFESPTENLEFISSVDDFTNEVIGPESQTMGLFQSHCDSSG